MPELEAIAAPAHDLPTLPLHDRTISRSETRLHRPTLANQVHNPNAESRTPTIQYIGLFVAVGSMPSAVEAHGGEIAMLIEKEPIVRENLRRSFPDANISNDIDDDSEWSEIERKPEVALGLLAGPPCQPFAPTGEGEMDVDPRARFLLGGVGDAVKKLRPETVDIYTDSSATEANDGATLQKPDDSIIQHWYSRIAPDGSASPERISISRLGSAAGPGGTTCLALRAKRHERLPAPKATDRTDDRHQDGDPRRRPRAQPR